MTEPKLCLGTVQFGMDYGINNKYGKPSLYEAFEMLDIALQNGVDTIDTASAYGNAEEVLGSYIRQTGIGKNIKLISKLRPNILDNTKRKVKDVILEEVEKSLENLNIDTLDGYLLHTPEYFYNKEVIEALIEAKMRNYVKNIGVSIYEKGMALDVVSSKDMDYIQVPYNILDQRIDDKNFFEKSRQNNITVFARSPFLQGLMIMNPENVPAYLQDAKKYLLKLDIILDKYKLSRAEASMAFSMANKNMDYIVIGVDNKNQLEENIRAYKSTKVSDEFIDELKREFLDTEKGIIIPSLWKK